MFSPLAVHVTYLCILKVWDINLNADFFQVNFLNQTLVGHDVFMWTKAWLGQKFLVKKNTFDAKTLS